ncbi:hypothetical protein HWV62_41773, partial [Athelia sp. TMB]
PTDLIMSSQNVGKQGTNLQLVLNSTPDQFHNVILDYLCQNCNTKTARAFARDSAVRHLDADGDEIHPDGGAAAAAAASRLDETLRLADIRQRESSLTRTTHLKLRNETRSEIRVHILSGRVDEATALLNEHFPSVLGDALLGSTQDSRPALARQPTSQPARAAYVAPTSLDPAHLSLNLRVLAFSEAARTVPLEYVPHTKHAIQPPSAPAAPYPKSSVHEHDDPEAKQTELLLRAQKLYAAANALENPFARGQYLQELGNVGGLLAYTHPENSPMARYLSQERRESVAEQIDSAILCSFILNRVKRSANAVWIGRPAVSTLELYARHTTVLWAYLSHDPRLRASGKRPVGLIIPPTDPESKETSLPAKASTDKDILEAVPPFDLSIFLDSKI